MLNNKFHMIEIFINNRNFIWYNTWIYLCTIYKMVEQYLRILIFEWRHVTSQFKESTQNNCFSF